MIERVIAMEVGESISLDALPDDLRHGPAAVDSRPSVPDISPEGVKLEELVDTFEKELILKALQMAGDKRSEAAKLLGLSTRSFRYRLEKHGL